MTGRTDDGWPEQYRDPRDRPHPSVLRITVESVEEDRDETRAAPGAAAASRVGPSGGTLAHSFP